MLYVNLLVEDDLSEAVARKMLRHFDASVTVESVYGKTGFGYIRKNARKFNQAARHANYLAITDLDQNECPAGLVEKWLGPRDSRFLNLRVAVREIEAWLMADRQRFAEFMGVDLSLVPLTPEQVDDPKSKVVALARRSSKPSIRSDLAPRPGKSQAAGPGYNATLTRYVFDRWRLGEARRHSPSLQKAVRSLKSLRRLDTQR